jgi:hypothetical protein
MSPELKLEEFDADEFNTSFQSMTSASRPGDMSQISNFTDSQSVIEIYDSKSFQSQPISSAPFPSSSTIPPNVNTSSPFSPAPAASPESVVKDDQDPSDKVMLLYSNFQNDVDSPSQIRRFDPLYGAWLEHYFWSSSWFRGLMVLMALAGFALIYAREPRNASSLVVCSFMGTCVTLTAAGMLDTWVLKNLMRTFEFKLLQVRVSPIVFTHFS